MLASDMLLWGATALLAFASGPAALSTPCGWNSLLTVIAPAAITGGRSRKKMFALVLIFGAGEAVSATIVGALVGVTGIALRELVPGYLVVLGSLGAIVAAIYAFFAMRGKHLQVPTSRWVVPAAWSSSGKYRFAFLFGLALGTGFLTIVPYIGFYLLLVLGLTGSIKLAVGGMLTFAFARWLPVAWTAVLYALAGRRAHGIQGISLARGLDRWNDRLGWLRTGALIAAVPALVGVALSTFLLG